MSDPVSEDTENLRVRPATELDAERLLSWRNDPETRAASRSTAEVSPEEHREWLDGVLDDPDRQLLIAEIGSRPVGQVRFDRTRGYRFEISVSLESGLRGRGLGGELIETGCEWLWRRTNATEVEALVRGGNESSLRAFAAVGFRPSGDGGEGFVRLVCPRPEPWAPWDRRRRELAARLTR
jgi:RimJ/RimL family protein N-acetyltransferase